MVKVVFGLGILSVLAGAAMLGTGIPINEFGIGNTLIQTGVTALCAGFVILALGAVLVQLSAMTALLARDPAVAGDAALAAFETPAPAPSRRSDGPPEAYPHDTPPLAAAAEPMEVPVQRSRLRVPRFGRSEPPLVQDAEDATLSPQPAPRGRPYDPLRSEPELVPDAGGEPEPAETAPRSSPAWRSPAASPEPAPASNMFANMWPARSGEPASATVEEAPLAAPVSPVERRDSGPVRPEPRAAALASAEVRPVSILKSGVVDGMAYTLFSDGSIEAELPDGTVRFASIAELREHLEQSA